MATLTLKKGRARPFWFGHPWVFSGAVAGVAGNPADGDVVELRDHDGRWIGRGFYNGRSQIRLRLCTFDADETVDAEFFRRRVGEAASRRRTLGLPGERTDAYRLVHAEGDGIPGLVVDVYGRVAVVQFASAGLLPFETAIQDAVEEAAGARTLLARASAFSDEKEGMEAPGGGEGRIVRGEDADGPVVFRENGLEFALDLARGQKTGAFLDQRENRTLFARFARGRRVLDAYCYAGGFALGAARAGAREVVGVDTSRFAIDAATESARRNGLAGVRFERGDALTYLEASPAASFDAVVVDPPKLVRSQRDLERAASRYVHLNRVAMRVLAPGGILASCSCSGRLHPDAFLELLNEAARAEGRAVTVLYRRSQGPDHPLRASWPEGEYLKLVLGSVS